MGFVILLALFSSAFATNLQDVLTEVDVFFETPRSSDQVQDFQNSMLHDIQSIRNKRHVPEASKQGVQIFRGTDKVLYTNYNLPSDLNGFELNGKIYAVSIQQFMPDGGKSENFLLVLYKIEEKTSRFLMQVPLVADGVVEVQGMKSNVIIAVTHKIADKNQQGCSIFSIVNDKLIRVQVLDTPMPLDVKLASNLQKVYMAVSTPESVQIFEWKGRHFDASQELKIKGVGALSFFVIDSILFLATAQDNELDGKCSLWEQNLESSVFKCRQYLEQKPATSVSYVRLEGLSRATDEYFLIFGYRNDSSIVYKQQGLMFQPFQRIPDNGTRQWLPYKDSKSFVLFQLTDRLIPFSYNGWRFVKMDVHVNHDSLRHGCTKLRTLHKSNGPWLIAINKNMEMGAMLQLAFGPKQPMHDTSELNTWCQNQKTDQGIDSVNRKFLAMPSSDDNLVLNQNLIFRQLQVENLKAKKFQGFSESLVNAVNEVALIVDDLRQILDDVESLSMASFNTITLKGPIESENLYLNCDENTPCVIPKLNTLLINEVPAQEFVDSIVNLSDGIQMQGQLNFETLRARNVSSIYFNDNLGSMVSRKNNLNLGNRLIVNGSVTFEGNLLVGGEIQDVVLDREHAVLVSEDQFLNGELMLDTATIKNLTLMESINGAKLKELGSDIDPNNHGLWDILTVGNLTVNGRIAGHPAWKYFNPETMIKADNVNIADGQITGVKISNLVRIDEGDYILNSDVTVLQPTSVENLHVTESINQIPLIFMMKLASVNDSIQSEPIKLLNVVGDQVIINGRATVNDIVHENRSLNYFITGKNNTVLQRFEGDSENEVLTCSGEGKGTLQGFIQTCIGSKCDTQILEDGVLVVSELVARSLNITGKINGWNWTEFVDDAVFKGENFTISGKNSVEGILNITDLVIDGLINNQTVYEFLNNSHNWVFDGVLTVDNLYLNGIAFLSDDHQNTFSLSNAHFEKGVTLRTINDIDFRNFVANVAYINESTKLGTVNFLSSVVVQNLTNYNLLNGAFFHETVVVKNSTTRQMINGLWLFHNNLVIHGDMIVHGQINGMDFDVLCEMSRNPPKIIVAGSVDTLFEPVVTNMINNFDMDKLLNDLWFKNKPTILKENVKISNSTIQGNVKLQGNLNGIKIENLAEVYLSKTIPRRMLAPINVKNLTSLGMVRASNITGEVNGLKLGKFAASVLQYGENQTFGWRPNFHELVISELGNNCTVNGLNLLEDVLRYSTESQVTGFKTVTEIVAKKLTIPAGKLLQGVDFDAWTRDAVLKDDSVIYGNITFQTVEIEDFMNVTGKIGGVKFDKKHLLRVNGNQTITGKKIFTGNLSIESLALNGPVNGVDMNNILQNSAYSDRDVILTSPTEIQNIQANHLEISGKLAGVNVTDFCSSAENRVNIDNLSDKLSELFTAAAAVHNNFANGAYYLDHYELVQKFDRNVSAIVSLPHSTELTIAVFRKYGVNRNVTLMAWDNRDKIFRAKKDLTHNILMGNTSLISAGHSYILVETWKQGGVLLYNDLEFPLNVTQTTCAVPFKLSLDTICVFLGQVDQRDSLVCGDINQTDLKVVQIFNATHCAQAASVKTANETWLAVIGAKPSRLATELFVTVFSKTDEEDLFRPRQDLPVLHPVSVSATTHSSFLYLVVASQHQPESVRSSLLAIFRYTALSNKWSRYQEISVEAPRFVSFQHLPTGQLALYVLTDNPARAFLVYLYRGIEGFVEETAGLAVHPGKFLSPFNSENNHFVGIAGDGFSQLLQAHFLGKRLG